MTEVWSFLQFIEDAAHETATKMASEARRLGALLGARPCGVAVARVEDASLQEFSQYGISKVYAVGPDRRDEDTSAEAAAQILSRLAERHQPTAIIFPGTPEGADVGARLAARLQTGIVTNCIDFEMEDETLVGRRPVCAGKAHARVAWATAQPYLATVDLTSLEAIAEDQSQPLDVIRETIPIEALKAKRLRAWRVPPKEIDLTEAEFVIGVGKGVDRVEFMETVQALADRVGAAVGGSRIACFEGVVPPERQIGASGKWISPRVYLTLGVSGASYHVMGIRGARHIIAVNTDRSAPIFKLAELGVVGDLYEVIPALLEALEQQEAGGD